MTGIQFITDEKGRKTGAIIDLKKHRALWEDIEDVLVSRSRQHEKRIPLEKVKADLIISGKSPARGLLLYCEHPLSRACVLCQPGSSCALGKSGPAQALAFLRH